LIEIELTGIRVAGGGKPRLHHLQLGGDDGGAAHEGALGDAGVVLAAEIGEVGFDDVLTPPDPGRASIDPG
jgi:hypothetical protein